VGRALYAALLATFLCFGATEARAAPPVVGFIGGLVAALGATSLGGVIMGLGGAGALAGASAGFAFGSSVLGGFLINAALSIGISSLARTVQESLRPRQTLPTNNPGARIVNLRQSVTNFEHAYGVVRKGGAVSFWQGKTGGRYYDVILAARRINGVRTWYADERTFTVDGDGWAVEDAFKSRSVSRLKVELHLGGPGQESSPFLMARFPEWTAAHDMAGLAHVVVYTENVQAQDFSAVYPSGREPAITPVIEGYLCYDPRDEETKFTTNAALIIADWIVSEDGLGRSVDWAKVAIEADVCDETLLDRNGNPLPRWQLSGAYASDDERETVRAHMGVACDAFFFEDANGVVGFHVGRYIEPTVEIVDDDIISVQYSEGPSGTDTTNAFAIQYSEPAIGYREFMSAPYVLSGLDETYEEDSLSAFWAPHHNQAVRIGKRLLLVRRAKYRANFLLKYQGIRLIGQRFFRVRHDEFGLDQVFEVDKLVRNDDGLSWTVEAHSVAASDFDFDSVTEEPARPARTTILSSSDVPVPVNVTAVSQPFAGSVAIHVSWDEPERDSLVYEVRYRVSGSLEPWTSLSVPVNQYHQDIVGLLDGETYDVQVRAMTSTGRASVWTPNTPIAVTAVVDSVPSGPVTGVNATGGTGAATLEWVAPNSANYFAARIYRNTTNSFGTATAIATAYGAPNSADEYAASGLAAGTYYFWIVSLNVSGVEGTPVATGAVTVT
jgi:hypothetical protein